MTCSFYRFVSEECNSFSLGALNRRLRGFRWLLRSIQEKRQLSYTQT